MTSQPAGQWILAFDASCCKCSKVAQQVQQSSGDKLDIKPLSDPEVTAWRTQALGDNAPFAPTLIRLEEGGKARAWTGFAMAARMATLLGPRSTLRLMAALGAVRKGTAAPADKGGSSGMGRGQFLRLAGAGAVAALFAANASPAAAKELTEAQKWVQANKAKLPQTYSTFARYDMAHRKAIYAELSPSVRSNMWVDHLKAYRAAHPDLSADQVEIIDRTVELARQESTFSGEPTPELEQQLQALRDPAIAAFGKAEAGALLATLGPAPAAAPKAAKGVLAECDCNWPNDYCDSGNCVKCQNCGACCTCHRGCGHLWVQTCNGECTN
ncbi:bacteriocin fulvocin C-related protein [Streptomyces ureilyticus]|uniref:Bacteriocin fulvocin C-related protein n=1 Tax=Streptomyces ureilyticus TaxID=1775131 RepID=A0ABX0DZI3_9ACTN|nr:bacteriocin fulvocin C-related protein [Streptomyces ureilyticus]NGO47346.1 bacteriocin fulvocin C-related protein [Streptomyces ureilyticus]